MNIEHLPLLIQWLTHGPWRGVEMYSPTPSVIKVVLSVDNAQFYSESTHFDTAVKRALDIAKEHGYE